jgi:hypothetical protein
MRLVLRRAALVACTCSALAGGAFAQPMPSDPGVVRPSPAGRPGDVVPPRPSGAPVVRPDGPSDTAPPATAQAPSNPGRGVDPLRSDPARAADPSNPVDPAAADPSRPADPTRAREQAPRAGVLPPGAPREENAPAGGVTPALQVAARDTFAHPPPVQASPSRLAACIQERDRSMRARCVHDASIGGAAQVR